MRSLILLVALLLSGCTTPDVITRTVEVKVPVPIPAPTPPEVARPQLAINQLTVADKQDPGKVVICYEATIKQLIGYAEQLETILDGYRHKMIEVSK